MTYFIWDTLDEIPDPTTYEKVASDLLGDFHTVIYAGHVYTMDVHGLIPINPHLETLEWNSVDKSQIHYDVNARSSIASTYNPNAKYKPAKGQAALESVGTGRIKIAKTFVGHLEQAHNNDFAVHYGSNWYGKEAGKYRMDIEHHGFDPAVASSIIAVMSPQNPWHGSVDSPGSGNANESVSLAKNLARMRDSGKVTVTHDDIDYADHLGTRHQIRKPDGSLALNDNGTPWQSSGLDNAQRKLAEVPGRIERIQPNHGLIPGTHSIDDIGSYGLAHLPIFKGRSPRAMRQGAIEIGLGQRPTQLTGPKTGAFQDNILNPSTSTRPTMDVWMGRAGTSSDPSDRRVPKQAIEKVLKSQHGYTAFGNGIVKATRMFNDREGTKYTPPQAQAIIWNDHQMRSGTVPVLNHYKHLQEHLKNGEEVFGHQPHE